MRAAPRLAFPRPGFFVALLAAITAAAPGLAYRSIGGVWETERGPTEFVVHAGGSDDVSDGSDLQAVRDVWRTWSCVEGSRLRIREDTEVEAPNVAAGDDGINTVFWDETGDAMLGPGTLGVASPQFVMFQGEMQIIDCDVTMNGFDSNWSTDGSQTDVGSIALHEVGHCIGFGHSCTDEMEMDCLPASESIMSPAWDGVVQRTPHPDDVEGILAFYPQDENDNSTCDGPYRVGEFCACQDDCANGLVCLEQDDGSNKCVKTCNADDPTACGFGFNCILGEKLTPDQPAPGICREVVVGEAAPPAAYCVNDGFSCGARDCVQIGAVGNRICYEGCQEDGDCPDGYNCADIVCVYDVLGESIACPEPPDAGPADDDDDDDDEESEEEDEEPEGCRCVAAPSSFGAGLGALALLGLLGVPYRRQRARRSSRVS